PDALSDSASQPGTRPPKRNSTSRRFTMNAFRIHAFGGPENLRCDELPQPTPGPGQVLVRLRAASLNYRDLLVLKGLYNKKLPLPAIPISDGAGEVAAVGAGVTRVKAGDRVAALFMQSWLAGEP